MAKRIDVKDVDIYYGKFHAVDSVTLSVPPRNVTAFITRLITIILSFGPLVGFTTTAARACACGWGPTRRKWKVP